MIFTKIFQVIHDSFECLYREYKAMMTKLAYSILGDHQYAEDAVQESFRILSGNMNKLDDVYSKRSKNYVYTVTKNEAITLYNKTKKNNENIVQFGDGEDINNIEGDLDIKTFCDENGFGPEIMEVLDRLDEIDKDIIVYKYGAGYSVKEIAKLMDKSADYVYKRLQRAMKKLRKLL